MVHILKIYYKAQNNEMQIRRLAVNSEVVSKFDLLAKKVKEIYPSLAQRSFDVKWKDSENDMIYMSSDEELAQALANAEDGLLKLYVYTSDLLEANNNVQTGVKSSYNEIHPDVLCDSCDQTIHGHRYKCLQCRNYDLCSACNATNKHGTHDMIKLVRPAHVPREWVFLGSRKIWRSMFGRFCSQDWRNQKEETDAKSPSPTDQSPEEKHQWQSVLDNLLKGDIVPVEKLIKENLGNFFNFVDSVAGVDVRLENCPFKRGPGPNTNDKKVDESSSGKPSETVKQNVTPKDEPLLAKSSDASNNNNKETIEEAGTKEDIPNAKDAVLVELTSAAPVAENTVNQQEPSKPVGLFIDLDTSINADGWTVLNGQEAEKKDAATSQETGARPKVVYPTVDKVNKVEEQQSESNPNVERNSQEPTSPISQNPEIVNALYKMQAMGFTNEGGWLERLLITKDGNINAALDALYPNNRRH